MTNDFLVKIVEKYEKKLLDVSNTLLDVRERVLISNNSNSDYSKKMVPLLYQILDLMQSSISSVFSCFAVGVNDSYLSNLEKQSERLSQLFAKLNYSLMTNYRLSGSQVSKDRKTLNELKTMYDEVLKPLSDEITHAVLGIDVSAPAKRTYKY